MITAHIIVYFLTHNPGRLFGTPVEADNASAFCNPDSDLAMKCDTVCFMKSDPSQSDRSTVCSSQSYICYCVKAGLIRAIHTGTGQKTLLRGHESPVNDLKFALSNSSVLCTSDLGIDGSDHIIVWKLVLTDDLQYETICSLQMPASRVLGHPLSEHVWSVSLGTYLCLFSAKAIRQENPGDFKCRRHGYADFPMHLSFQADISGRTCTVQSLACNSHAHRHRFLWQQTWRFQGMGIFSPCLQRTGRLWWVCSLCLPLHR
jgi:WD40 repeat protein